MKPQSIKFVSLGPGDPELITLKGYRALQEADYIYCPGTKSVSRSGNIITSLGISKQNIIVFNLPMIEDGIEAKKIYQHIAEEIIKYSINGKKIVVTANGHNGLYSSGFYINQYVSHQNIPCELIAGIPAFISAGTLAHLHIAKNNEPLTILPIVKDEKSLEYLVSQNHQIVLMKPSKSENIIKDFIKSNVNIKAHYFENIGIKNLEYYTTEKSDILRRKFPYFSLLIIKI